jgi:hypothetical protein
MSKIKELDVVALTCDLPEHKLARGDAGKAMVREHACRQYRDKLPKVSVCLAQIE